MGFLDRFRRRRSKPTGPAPSAQTISQLVDFIASREGVEGYIEPPTPIYAMTLVLVAGDGEFIRRPVRDERQARGVCGEHGIPVYDARIVGYPRRMKDYQRGQRAERVSLDDLPPLRTVDDRDD